MSERHSPSQRKRLALKAKDIGVEAVARQSGVKPGTVRAWRAEFGLGAGTGGSVQALAAPPPEVDLRDAANVSRGSSTGSENVDDIGDLVEQASDALSLELSSWLADDEGRERASERLGELISDWEAEHGELTAQELEAARTQLYR